MNTVILLFIGSMYAQSKRTMAVGPAWGLRRRRAAWAAALAAGSSRPCGLEAVPAAATAARSSPGR